MPSTPKGVDHPTPRPPATYDRLMAEHATYDDLREQHADYAAVENDAPKAA